MNTYHINVSPSPSIGLGYITVGETPNHALAELSLSLRQNLKICEAHIQSTCGRNTDSWDSQKLRAREVLRVIRKPGRICYGRGFEPPTVWPKVTVTQVTKAITAAYVEDVWLGNT